MCRLDTHLCCPGVQACHTARVGGAFAVAGIARSRRPRFPGAGLPSVSVTADSAPVRATSLARVAMAPFYGCRDPGTKLDGVKLAPVTAKTSKTGPRHVAIVRVSLANFLSTLLFDAPPPNS